MRRLVSTVALGAALVSVGVSIWREDGVVSALTRAVIAYLAFFIVSSLLALVYRAGVAAENRPKPPAPRRAAPPAKEPGKG